MQVLGLLCWYFFYNGYYNDLEREKERKKKINRCAPVSKHCEYVIRKISVF